MAATYCTATQVREILEKVTTQVMDDTKVDKMINRAENIINSYVGTKYTVPFTAGSIPPFIETACTDIAAFFVARTQFTGNSKNMSAWVKELYTMYINDKGTGLLDQIKKGDLPILDDSGDELQTRTDTIESSTEDWIPTMDIDNPENWGEDINRLEDIADERDT